ncbi:hypothetical protein [Nonlabens ponticola]|uniref:Hydrolase n=1 Tax=Nonlabens ponticola TaxID=2496866 RepID=A0A3S9MZL2_9FLAO|nr:hypothetical protein [Nonlabens ponticola]AZQ44503.1 hypothetical protein EJ995_09705 [Nonlabens ponticola]
MRRNLYLYLFIFASLIALVFYINGRKYQEALEKDVTSLRAKAYKQERELDSIEDAAMLQGKTFSLTGNQEAQDYLEKLGYTQQQIEQQVVDKLLDLNLEEGGNPLVPYIGQGRGFQINDTKFVNHKWVLANYSDNYQWGELLINYNISEDNQIELTTLHSVLYDKYR